MAEVSLEWIGAQLARLIEKADQTQDDIRVLSAIVMRQDGTLSAVLTELRAMHARSDRLSRRVEKLEDREPTA